MNYHIYNCIVYDLNNFQNCEGQSQKITSNMAINKIASSFFIATLVLSLFSLNALIEKFQQQYHVVPVRMIAVWQDCGFG